MSTKPVEKHQLYRYEEVKKKMGQFNVKHGGRFIRVDENATGTQLKHMLGVDPDAHVVAPNGREIPDSGSVGNYLHDGDPVSARPEFEYW